MQDYLLIKINFYRIEQLAKLSYLSALEQIRLHITVLARTEGRIVAESVLPNLVVNKEDASQQLKSQIEKGEILRDREINSETELQQAIEDCQNWSQDNKELLSKLFDTPSIAEEYGKFSYYSDIRIDTSKQVRVKHQYDQFLSNLEAYRVWVGCHIDHLKIIYTQRGINIMSIDTPKRTFGSEIFIVHGRDDGTKDTVARFIEKLHLEVTILHEKPSGGKTIIEKLEEYADNAGYAIVILTPDDVGALKDRIEDESKPRARQNVVFELGYFIGKLGRDRVCPIFKGKVEKPSDIDGIVYVTMENEDWKQKLGQEMKNAGFTVDMNKIL